MPTISAIHTPCKKCAFAIYENKTQTGCYLGYLDKYKNKNVEILEVYDEEKEFCVINEKKCLGYRENSWFDKRNLSDLSLDEKAKKLMENNYLHYLIIINLEPFDSDEKLTVLKNELSSLVIKPQKIVLIRYQNNKNHPYQKLQQLLDSCDLDCEWRVQTMLDNEKTFDNIMYETMNHNKKHRFIMIINGVGDKTNDIINKGSSVVYDEMDRFVVIRNQSKSVILFSAANYRYSLFVENKDILLSDQDHIII